MAGQKKEVEVTKADVARAPLGNNSAASQGSNTRGGIASPQAPPSPRRAPGTKEIIPMAWKLVGTSAGTPVTLLRSIERADVEAQQTRLEIEGYYQQLTIYPIAAKVPLSSSHVKARKRVIDDAMTQIGESKKAAEEAKRKAALRRAEAKRIKAIPKAKRKAKVKKAKAAKKTAKPKAAKKATKAKASKKAKAKKATKKTAKAPKKTVKKAAKKAAKKTVKKKAAAKSSKTSKASKSSKSKVSKKAARKRK